MPKKILFFLVVLLIISCTAKNKFQDDISKYEIINNVNNKSNYIAEHILGDYNAPIEIIEYSDFECPYSKMFYKEILPLIKIEYISTGKAKLVFRNLPLNSVHPNAHKAAEAAECAGLQGKFFEMHDKLFENGVSGGTDSFKKYASELNLSIKEFNDCLDGNITRQYVIDDFYSGVNNGVKGTPAFFINNALAPAMRNYEEFSRLLNAAEPTTP